MRGGREGQVDSRCGQARRSRGCTADGRGGMHRNVVGIARAETDLTIASMVPPPEHPGSLAFFPGAAGALRWAWQCPAQQVPSWLSTTPSMSLQAAATAGGDASEGRGFPATTVRLACTCRHEPWTTWTRVFRVHMVCAPEACALAAWDARHALVVISVALQRPVVSERVLGPGPGVHHLDVHRLLHLVVDLRVCGPRRGP